MVIIYYYSVQALGGDWAHAIDASGDLVLLSMLK